MSFIASHPRGPSTAERYGLVLEESGSAPVDELCALAEPDRRAGEPLVSADDVLGVVLVFAYLIAFTTLATRVAHWLVAA